MKYLVRVGDVTHEVVIDGETVSLDGHAVRAHVEPMAATPLHAVTIDNTVHRVLARRGTQRGQFDLALDGYRFTVEALDERTKAIRDLSGTSARPAGPAHLLAPMPGLVVRITVAAGDTVRAGQSLVVMEAMKMENELRAPVAGIVKRVAVTPGSAVEKGALLLDMESSDGK